jgi:phytoene dehydrogenase-like protein
MDALPRYDVSDASNDEIVKGMQLLCPSTDYLNRAYGDYLGGVPSRDPAAIGMTFSAIDPTLAPEGKHTLFIWGQWYPYRLAGNGSWNEIEQREVEKLLGVVERFAPGTREQVRDIYVQTPPGIEEKHNMPNANVMHVEMSIDQMFMFRPLPELAGYKTPLKNLYIANAGMHPGGGIFGAAGYNCADVVRRSLRRRLF